MAGLFVRRVGVGPRVVVLLHGGAIPGEACWHAQLPLADRFTLEIVDRVGYGHGERISAGEDLDADALLVPALLGDGAHLGWAFVGCDGGNARRGESPGSGAIANSVRAAGVPADS